MGGPIGLDPLLIAAWANEARIARQGNAEAEREHGAEDREAGVARGRDAVALPRRSDGVLARLRRLMRGR